MKIVIQLTNDQCHDLENRVVAKLQDMFAGKGADVNLELCKAVIPAIICTLNEYAQMQEQK